MLWRILREYFLADSKQTFLIAPEPKTNTTSIDEEPKPYGKKITLAGLKAKTQKCERTLYVLQ